MGYYHYKPGMTIPEIVSEWQRGNKLYDDDFHAIVSAVDLWPYREFNWIRTKARNSPEEWDELLLQLAQHGWKKKNPAIVLIGKNGKAMVGEGNHRLAIAKELELPIPVLFLFREKVEKTAAHGPEVVFDSGTTRIERLTYSRAPLSTSGDGSRASDKATVHVVEYKVTTGIRPKAERPMFLAREKRFKTLPAARKYSTDSD